MSVRLNWFQDPFWFGTSLLESFRGSSLDPVLGALTFVLHQLGGNLFFMILLSATYLLFDRKLGLRLAIGLLTSGISNGLVKGWLESPRPDLPWYGPGRLEEFAYGFPSGHVQTSVVVWGLLFLHSRSRLVRTFAILIPLLMPFSRMYAGVHFAGDVLGGLILGGIGLAGTELLFRFLPELDHPRPFPGQNRSNTKSIALVIVVFTLPSILLYSHENALAKNKSFEQTISASGALAGFLIGILLCKSYSLDWKPVDSISETVKRIAVWLVGVLLFYFLLGWLIQKFLPENPVARYLRYGIVSSYIGFFSVYLLSLKKGETDTHS
ncbi:phosphatase PAP2 family protein [Leptospira gomenensis]|uniref:Phosphatase PAP2 family protein n=1 Tax=Leptospira gomenensis TaxID=2484974 RepID=A0A5F1YA81_9LEPT|nr:phosphatase PAP2 family protein [Leptospira gomenensis]TGK33736.1 phosphatase PAP2 family protein [Leptospira gomenensis]TGK41979.1 phosphatase PAP2 family protein [Leptospira gomenensis]TGK44199.1 phosphatase PAP2 family protein [Leptospira gomenensis]TGK57987.1 phosphatase PAP2 family protein [Leptospira gomenensis]